MKLNRDSNILPYEYNAATIDGQPFNGEMNYINASFISGPMISEEYRNMFLATQAPLPDTVFQFWATVRTYQVPLILMLANVSEEGRTKSEVYWPNEVNKEKVVTNGEVNLSIICTAVTEAQNENFIRRKFLVDNSLEVEHIQILNWPDHSIPTQGAFDTIQFSIDTINAYLISKRLPVLIHCSAGVGRTGTFISIFNIIKCFEKISEAKNLSNSDKAKEIFPFFNVFNVVRKLREQRYSMVSDSCQYKFIYSYVLNWLKSK